MIGDSKKRRWRAPTAVFLAAFAVYMIVPLLNGEPSEGSGDTVCTKLLPITLLTRGSLTLDSLDDIPKGSTDPYYFLRVGGHVWSRFPVGGAILLVPIYAAASSLGLDVLHKNVTCAWLANVTAASLCSLAVLLLYLTYAPRGRWRALVAAAALGLGTNVWPLASQDLWQQTFGVALMAWVVLLAERASVDVRWLRPMGLACGLLFFVRPGNAPLVGILGLHILLRSRREAIWFAASALPFLAFVLTYNFIAFGHLFGGYGNEAASLRPWPTLLEGLPGLLVSPARGLLVHSPWVLLGIAAFIRPAENRMPVRLLFAALVGSQIFLYGSYPGWYGGHCYGPRFLIEILPVCAALLWDALPALQSFAGRTATTLTLAWSIGIAATGYVVPWSEWNRYPDVDHCPGRFWDWRDSPWASVWFGLPDRCTHPYDAGPDEVPLSGAGIAFGAGWSIDGDRRVALAEAVLLVRPHGQPLNQLQLWLRSEPALDGPQEVEATIDGRKTSVRLERTKTTQLALPLAGAETSGEIAVTLRFAQAKRRSWSDIRRLAASLEGLRFGFSRAPTVSAIPVSR